MILHLSFKLDYFRDHKWEPSWIDKAHELARMEYENSYHDCLDLLEAHGTKSKDLNQGERKENAAQSMFVFALKMSSSATEQSELDRYLTSDVEPVGDVIQWWIDHCSSFPRLSRMALDYLSIPATSVECKRQFSQAHHLLHYEQNRLSAQSSQALMCVGNWSLKGWVHDDDLLGVVEDGKVKVPDNEEDLADITLPPDFDHKHLAPVSHKLKGKQKQVVSEGEDEDEDSEDEDDTDDETEEEVTTEEERSTDEEDD